jgi:hypothetical protein
MFAVIVQLVFAVEVQKLHRHLCQFPENECLFVSQLGMFLNPFFVPEMTADVAKVWFHTTNATI